MEWLPGLRRKRRYRQDAPAPFHTYPFSETISSRKGQPEVKRRYQTKSQCIPLPYCCVLIHMMEPYDSQRHALYPIRSPQRGEGKGGLLNRFLFSSLGFFCRYGPRRLPNVSQSYHKYMVIMLSSRTWSGIQVFHFHSELITPPRSPEPYVVQGELRTLLLASLTQILILDLRGDFPGTSRSIFS